MQKLLIFVLVQFFFTRAFAQEIALTFDDAPMPDGAIFSGKERTSKIIDALKTCDIKQAAFFVITCQLDGGGMQRLKMYSEAGHLLANHSHSHNGIRAMGTAKYIRDIQKADSILKSTKLPYYFGYRYPFLDEGDSKGSRDSIRAALSELSLRNAYITIDNYDWYINNAFTNAIRSNAKINYKRLKKFYFEHIWNSVQFYDNIGRQTLGRSPKHVLLLHENDLAALFLGELIQFLRDKGCRIISPEEAYTDPIAKEIPDVLFNGQGRVGAIGFARGLKPAVLVQQSEDEKYLDQLLSKQKVFR